MKQKNTSLARLRGGVALVALLGVVGLPAGAFADTASEIKALKARLKELEAKVAHADKQVKNGLNSVKGPAPDAPPPVFISFKNGLFVETEDKDFSFKIGGRIQTDGGFLGASTLGTSSNSYRSNVGFRRARLEVEGKAYKNWYYKFQYDFTGSGVTGIRDAFIAYREKLLPAEITSQPVTFQVGNQYEPFGLETLNSSKHITFIERAMTEALTPARHIGASVGVGDKQWAVKAGLYSTSPQDAAANPPAGQGQYWDAAIRAIYAPIVEKDAVVHLGASFLYHQPDNTSAGTDANFLRPGQATRDELGILGGGGALIHTVSAADLSCYKGSTVVTGNSCLKYSYNYGFEGAVAYGPFSAQAEYVGAQYERDSANAALRGVAGGSSLNYSSYYIYGSVFLTGESRAASYRGYDRDWNTPGTFHDVAIKNPLGKGGWGAWEAAARFSELNLNPGSGVNGGREENFTLALNWYPVRGFRVQANWTHVLTLVGPSDNVALTGQHPDIFLARAQVFW